jgi:hypothetical protein
VAIGYVLLACCAVGLGDSSSTSMVTSAAAGHLQAMTLEPSRSGGRGLIPRDPRRPIVRADYERALSHESGSDTRRILRTPREISAYRRWLIHAMPDSSRGARGRDGNSDGRANRSDSFDERRFRSRRRRTALHPSNSAAGSKGLQTAHPAASPCSTITTTGGPTSSSPTVPKRHPCKDVARLLQPVVSQRRQHASPM